MGRLGSEHLVSSGQAMFAQGQVAGDPAEGQGETRPHTGLHCGLCTLAGRLLCAQSSHQEHNSHEANAEWQSELKFLKNYVSG